MKRPHPALIAVLAAAAAVHLAVAVSDFGTLARNGFLYDDSFYAFQIARNIAHGNGPTFDGITLTNGFQPLYVALLVPVFAVTGDNASLPVHIALAFSALLTVATGWLLYRLVSRRASRTTALIATAAWAFSPVVMRQSANGLETSLALFMLAASVTWYLDRVRPPVRPTRHDFAGLGVLLGLSFLARADLGFLSLVMLLDYLIVLRSRGAGAGWWRAPAGAAAVALLVCTPWLVYGTVAVGVPISESGRATRYLSMAYAPFFNLGDGSIVRDGPTLTFIAEHIERSIATLKVTPLVHPFFRAMEKTAGWLPAGGVLKALASVIEVASLVAFGVWWWYRRRTPRGRASREFDFLLLMVAMFIAAYSGIVFGVFFFLRYYYPVYFVAAIFTGLLLNDVIAWVRMRSRVVRRSALALAGAYAAALLFMGYTSAFRTTPVYGFYDAALWVATHTDASETIGVFQGGAIGYLSHRRVINLDGKVNGAAFQALRAHRLDDYVRRSGIDMVMDSARVLDLFFGPWSDAEWRRVEAASVFSGREHGVPGWIGYRVNGARGMNASGSRTTASHSTPSTSP